MKVTKILKYGAVDKYMCVITWQILQFSKTVFNVEIFNFYISKISNFSSWSYDKTDVALLLVRHSYMLSLGWR